MQVAYEQDLNKKARSIAKATADRDPRRALQKFADALNLDASAVAFALGLRGSPNNMAVELRRWLDGNSISPEKAESYALRAQRLLQLGESVIKPTRNLAIVHEACEHAARRNVIVGISSRAGYGKTVGLETYRRIRGAVYYAHDKASSTKDAMIQISLASGLGRNMQVSIGKLRRALVNHLREIGRPLLIIDEADTIQFRTLEVLRGICDELRCGMAMAGVEGYMERLLTEKQYGRRPEQLLSRVVAIVKLLDPDDEEIQMIADDYGVRGAREIDFIRQWALVTGGYRRARMLLEDSQEIAADIGAKKINLAVLKRAAQYLPGQHLVENEGDPQ